LGAIKPLAIAREFLSSRRAGLSSPVYRVSNDMRRGLIRVLLALSVVAIGPSYAEKDRHSLGTGDTWTAASITCARWREARFSDDVLALVAEGWVNGYLTAARLHDEEVEHGDGSPGFMAWLDAYCDDHRLMGLREAVRNLAEQRRVYLKR
jgi:hypothetical protein